MNEWMTSFYCPVSVLWTVPFVEPHRADAQNEALIDMYEMRALSVVIVSAVGDFY